MSTANGWGLAYSLSCEVREVLIRSPGSGEILRDLRGITPYTGCIGDVTGVVQVDWTLAAAAATTVNLQSLTGPHGDIYVLDNAYVLMLVVETVNAAVEIEWGPSNGSNGWLGFVASQSERHTVYGALDADTPAWDVIHSRESIDTSTARREVRIENTGSVSTSGRLVIAGRV